MNIKPIKTKKEYKAAMARLEQIFDATKGSADGDELELLGIIIEKYENEHFPISLQCLNLFKLTYMNIM